LGVLEEGIFGKIIIRKKKFKNFDKIGDCIGKMKLMLKSE
jgi:hypothetical protein